MSDKLNEELRLECVELMLKLNKKQGKLIGRLSRELTVERRDAGYLSSQWDICIKERDKAIAAKDKLDSQVKALNEEIGRLKRQITEESTANLAKIKAEMAEQNETIQELAREKLESGRRAEMLRQNKALQELAG